MTVENSLYREVLHAAEQEIQIAAGAVRKIVAHPGETGREIEHIFHRALERVLPPRIGVTSGFVIDCDGNKSRQLDVILFDKLGAPAVFTGSGLHVLPAECTYAAGEIKTALGAREIDDSFEKCRSYKKLNRTARFERKGPIKQTFSVYREESQGWPPIFFLLAIESSSLKNFDDTCATSLHSSGLDRFERIDCVMCLDGNMKINATLSPNPEDGGLTSLPTAVNLCSQPGQDWATYPSNHPWALFCVLLNAVITQAPNTSVNMVRYLDGKPF